MENSNELLVQIEQLKDLKPIEINNFKNSQVNLQIEIGNFNDFMNLLNLNKKKVFLKKYLFKSDVIEKKYQKYISKCKDILLPIEHNLMCFRLYYMDEIVVYSFISKTNKVVERNLEKFYEFVSKEETKDSKKVKNDYIEKFYKQNDFIESIVPDIVNSIDFELCTNKKLRQHFLKKYIIENNLDDSGFDIELIADILYTKVKKNKKQKEAAIFK